MLLAHQTANSATIVAVARIAVIAEFVFTATAVVAHALAWHSAYSPTERWIALFDPALPHYRPVLASSRVDADRDARSLALQAAAAKQASPQRCNTLARSAIPEGGYDDMNANTISTILVVVALRPRAHGL